MCLSDSGILPSLSDRVGSFFFWQGLSVSQPVVFWNLLCRPGWSQFNRDLPASVFKMLGLKTWVTLPGQIWILSDSPPPIMTCDLRHASQWNSIQEQTLFNVKHCRKPLSYGGSVSAYFKGEHRPAWQLNWRKRLPPGVRICCTRTVEGEELISSIALWPPYTVACMGACGPPSPQPHITEIKTFKYDCGAHF